MSYRNRTQDHYIITPILTEESNQYFSYHYTVRSFCQLLLSSCESDFKIKRNVNYIKHFSFVPSTRSQRAFIHAVDRFENLLFPHLATITTVSFWENLMNSLVWVRIFESESQAFMQLVNLLVAKCYIYGKDLQMSQTQNWKQIRSRSKQGIGKRIWLSNEMMPIMAKLTLCVNFTSLMLWVQLCYVLLLDTVKFLYG